VRTFAQNLAVVGELWPMAEFTGEEKKLWNDDLSGLDQDTLYESLRSVKRLRESLYPQLPWVLASYRELSASRRARSKSLDPHPKLALEISDEEDAMLAGELTAMIEASSPSDFAAIEEVMLGEKLPRMRATTASRLLRLLSARRDPSPSQCDGPSPEDIQQREEAAALLRNHADRIREKQEAST